MAEATPAAVGVVLHPRRDAGPALEVVARWARRRGTDVLGLAGECGGPASAAGSTVAGVQVVDQAELARRTDLLVSLGGDGTMLRTLRLSFAHGVPVLGVNLGRLGFLAEVDVPDLGVALDAVGAGHFTVEPRVAIEACRGARRAVAFNDIALARVPGHGQAAVALHVEGQPFVRYVADALVVATPTGSTAYSFSAGGPLVSPRVEGLLVVPVAPHSPFNRAVLLSTRETLRLELLPTSGRLAVEVDGELVAEAAAGDWIDVVTHPGAGSVVRLGRTSFYQRARRKLGLTDAAELAAH